MGSAIATESWPPVTYFTLTLEGQPPVHRPTLAQVLAAVDSLTPDGGPGFLILDGPGGDYVQAGGGDGAFTVEWREYTGRRFRHFVAGHPDRPAEHFITIRTNGCSTSRFGRTSGWMQPPWR